MEKGTSDATASPGGVYPHTADPSYLAVVHMLSCPYSVTSSPHGSRRSRVALDQTKHDYRWLHGGVGNRVFADAT